MTQSVQGDQKKKKEQASDVENLPVVENLTLVGSLTAVEIFQGLRLLKRPMKKFSPCFFAKVDNHLTVKYTFCFPTICVLVHQCTVTKFPIYIMGSDT